jgi:hypothetical protein
LDCVGVDLMQDVFAHGQLDMALLRIRHCSDVIVCLPALEHSTTMNVAYKESSVNVKFTFLSRNK